ncbi:MAG: YDG domain-containing protein, partial [Chitinophagaceae bacterium]
MLSYKFLEIFSSLKSLRVALRSVLRLSFFVILFLISQFEKARSQEYFISPALKNLNIEHKKSSKQILSIPSDSTYLWSIGKEVSNNFQSILNNSLIKASLALKSSITSGVLNSESIQDVFEINPNSQKVDWEIKASQIFKNIYSELDTVEIHLTSISKLNGAMGAFSSRGGKYPILFFAREFIENKAGWFYPKATELNLTKIVLEEIGHYIDFRLNKGIDSKGDEGELFAYLTLGHTLSESDYHLIKNRDDFDKISLNGDLFEIEDATIYFKAAFEQPANDDKKTGNQVYGSLKFVSNPDNSTFTNSLSGSNQIFGTLYYINSSGVSTSVYGSFTSRYPTGNSVIEALSFQSSPTGTNLLVCLPNATVANYGPNKTGLNNSANFTSSNNIGTLLDQYIGTARTISIYQGGETQQTTVGTSVSTNPSIKVTDQNNNPVSGVLVNFSIISGNGSVSQATVTTDALGIASTVWTLGTIAGSNSLQASSTGLIGSPLTFNATGIAGELDHFAISSISSPQTAGTAITGVTLTAQDVYNNTVTSFTGTVTYSGTAGITGTSGTFTAGQLTGVSITPTSAGSSKTFIVTGGSPSKTGTAAFDVNAGGTPPSGLAYPSSTQTTYGTSGTISQSSVSGTPTINYSISSSAPAGTISITSSGTVEYYSTTPAGSYSITITASNNYGTTSTTISLVVNKKPLTVSGITVTTKTYNGTTSATLNTSAATLVTPASGDAVTLDVSGYTATFDTKNIGSAKPVTVTGLSLSGTDAGNYTLTQPSGLTGEITSAALTVSGITVTTKTYNGTT